MCVGGRLGLWAKEELGLHMGDWRHLHDSFSGTHAAGDPHVAIQPLLGDNLFDEFVAANG